MEKLIQRLKSWYLESEGEMIGFHMSEFIENKKWQQTFIIFLWCCLLVSCKEWLDNFDEKVLHLSLKIYVSAS